MAQHVHDENCDHDHEHELDLGTLSIPAQSRMRRMRMTERHRRLVRETILHPSNFIQPLFAIEGKANFRKEIASMPGVFQLGVDGILSECENALKLGLGGVILFGLPEHKDAEGTEAYNDKGIIQTTIRAIKKRFPELLVATDVCLCEYTDHGHCGIVQQKPDGTAEIANDETVVLLVQEALSHAEAGADIVAPSDMMDGRIGAIRDAFDSLGFNSLPIMAYSAKHASAFYGPFRDAAGSAPAFGDRKSHQMDPANSDEALRAIRRDIDEGADIVMVKPALPALDLIRRVKDEFNMPTAAYQVSGEYAMIKAAAERGWIDEERVMLETLTAIKRAGATIILTYYAQRAAQLVRSL